MQAPDPERPVETPRQRHRAQTREEIKQLAREQLDAGGPDSISISAIAKRLGVSAPALYRYFASRDELVSELIRDAYEDLFDTLSETVRKSSRRSPAGRFRGLTQGYRRWALEHPQLYLLAFAARPAGYEEPEELVPGVHQSMVLLLITLNGLVPERSQGRHRSQHLDRQLRAWAATRRGTPDLPAAILRLGPLTWTRMHGVVSLELLGVFTAMGLDGELLFADEVESVIELAQQPGRS